MAKNKFNPKSKILGRYFNSMPYGIKEINNIFCQEKPLYAQSHINQYRVVVLLLLINKREENLNHIINFFKNFKNPKLNKFFFDIISSDSIEEYKKTISSINGLSERKRTIFYKLLIDKNLYNKEGDYKYKYPSIGSILRGNERLKDIWIEKDEHLKMTAIYQYFKRSKLNIPRINGKDGNISFSVLRKDDSRSLFLDNYSDCCQGLLKEGSDCVKDGIENPNAGFLVFERKNIIFAQGWIRKVSEDILLIDSIEFKGDFNESLISAIKASVKELGFHFKHIYLGISPNRNEISQGLSEYIKISEFLKAKYSKLDELNDIEKVFAFVEEAKIYSDAKKEVIKLK